MNVSFVKQICGVVIVVLVLATFWSWMLDVKCWRVDGRLVARGPSCTGAWRECSVVRQISAFLSISDFGPSDSSKSFLDLRCFESHFSRCKKLFWHASKRIQTLQAGDFSSFLSSNRDPLWPQTCCHVMSRCHFSQVVQELFAHRRSGAKSMVSSNGSVQHLSFQWFNHVEALQSDCLINSSCFEAGGPMATHQGQPFQQQRTATMPCRSMPCTREEGGIRPTLHIDVHGCRDPLEPPEITPGHDANGCFWVCHGLSTFILMKSRALFSTFVEY